MFGKKIRLRPFLGGIVVTAAIVVVGVPSALASKSSRVGSEASASDAVARYLLNHRVAPQQVQGFQLGRQARPGAVVLDRSGGYYDPQRSIYVPSGKAIDRTGGHYDPERSIYVPGTNQPQ